MPMGVSFVGTVKVPATCHALTVPHRMGALCVLGPYTTNVCSPTTCPLVALKRIGPVFVPVRGVRAVLNEYHRNVVSSVTVLVDMWFCPEVDVRGSQPG